MQAELLFDYLTARQKRLFIGYLNGDPQRGVKFAQLFGRVTVSKELLERQPTLATLTSSPPWIHLYPGRARKRLQNKTASRITETKIYSREEWDRIQKAAVVAAENPASSNVHGIEVLKLWEECRHLPLVKLRAQVSHRLWRCGRGRCKKFFLADDDRKRVYCSPKCGSAVTAKARVYKGRSMKREADLRRARKALAKCRCAEGWKRRAAIEAGVTPHFITRGIKSRELSQPK